MKITPITIDFNNLNTGNIPVDCLKIHYMNHYLIYVKNTNEFLDTRTWTKSITSLEELINIVDLNSYAYNNASQIWNHEFFFTQFSNNPNHKIGAKLEYIIHSSYDSVNKFIDDCIITSTSHFGSGYLWVYLNERGFLIVETGDNAENLVKRKKCIPILCIDLWEHSYYLSHGSNRKQYLIDLFETAIDWNIIENRINIELS